LKGLIAEMDKKNTNMELQENIHIFKRPPITTVKPHIHKYIELVYICSGRGYLSIQDKSIQVSRGDLLFYNIGELHCLNSDSEMNAVNIQIHPQILDESLTLSQNAVDILTLALFNDFSEIADELKPEVTFAGKQLIEIEMIIFKMLEEYNEKEPGYRSILFGYLNVLFGKLFRQIYVETKMDIRKDMPRIAEGVLNYIEKNYSKKLTLEELAGKNFYNPSYFSSVFKECFGVSPIQYINKKRLDKVFELLKVTNMSIEEIMRSVGYTDKKHFYNTFKEATGCTPGQYRKRLKV
jgi:AraC-like DNA-binding protein/mannose-6-phosphate isomerase-like protein (cupin superfamily)